MWATTKVGVQNQLEPAVTDNKRSRILMQDSTE